MIHARLYRLPIAALSLLTAINMINYADRYLLGGAQELMRRDLGLTGGARTAEGWLADTSLGTLTSLFFVAYVLAAPVFGFLGDRLSRTRLVAGSVAIFSLATIATGLSTSYPFLMMSRAFVGLGAASFAASGAALLADFFEPARRGKAIGVFYASMPLGAALGFLIGGAIGSAFGWRWAFFCAGIPGILLSLMILFLPEPHRGASEEDEGKKNEEGAVSPLLVLCELARNRAFVLATVGMTLMTFAAGGIGQWMPSFLVRLGGLSPSEAALGFGGVTATAGLLGTLAGTLLGEWAQRRTRAGYFLVTGAGFLAAAPIVFAMTRAKSPVLVLSLVFVALFLVMLNTGPLNTALVNAAPSRIRASAISINLVIIHLLGDALSPTLIGYVSDRTASLGFGIALNALPLFLGGFLLVVGPWCYLRLPPSHGEEPSDKSETKNAFD